ncbi:CAMK/PKD protein kinase [Blastomyces percursus]|uniref:non-specific serine/threonine protein kinase n=1 Tax=Blastomyces percursus TaxID=1658174 RepID=A0A1J9R3D9_9EURO|nr:CAMK/PKD protein kinase [Blastomyces percursus]
MYALREVCPQSNHKTHEQLNQPSTYANPGGNLEEEHKRHRITPEETVLLFLQCLMAIRHLHANHVTHRDLKPANILVKSRVPFHVKLCDFGLAKVADEDTVLRTFCGTYMYCAPEIYLGESYSPAVDLWSLGVIILQYAYGFNRKGLRIPGEKGSGNVRKQGLAWCHDIVKQVNDWDSDRLIDLLSTGVLRIEPRERLSADESLRRVKDLEPLVSHSFSLESTSSVSQRSSTSDDDGGPTLIMGGLWGSGGVSSNAGSFGSFGIPRLASEEQDRCTVDGSALQKRRRSPARSSTLKAMDASQPKRFQRSISSPEKTQGQTSVRDSNPLRVKLKELINLDAQLVAQHAQQGCHFTSDDYFQLPFSKQRIMIRNP